MASGVGDGKAEDKPDGRADDADEHALSDKNVAHLGGARAHRHEHGNVFRFFHHHHDERDQNVQRGDEDDQPDGDEGDQAFEAEGVEQRLVLFHPVGGHEAFAGGIFELAGNLAGLVDVIDLEFDDGDEVAEAEESLRNDSSASATSSPSSNSRSMTSTRPARFPASSKMPPAKASWPPTGWNRTRRCSTPSASNAWSPSSPSG